MNATSPCTIAPEYELIDGVIVNKTTHLCVPDAFVDSIGLSVRASNSLRRGGISMLSQLICQSREQLTDFRNMGAKTAAEISEFVPKFLKSHETDATTIDEKGTDAITAGETGKTVQVNLDEIILPELNPEIPVLAEDYAVVDGVIYSRQTYKIIQDAPIEVLNLSVRATNCLYRAKRSTIASLIGYPYDEFRKIRNLGTLSAREIQEKLELYLDAKQNESSLQATFDHRISTATVLEFFSGHEFEALTYDLIKASFEEVEDEDLNEALGELVENGHLVKDGDSYSLYLQSFFDYIDGLDSASGLDERAIRVLQMRASGSTLEEVGQLEGTSRERIRQIEMKSQRRIMQRATAPFAEDKYAYIFSTYDFDKEFYRDYLEEDRNIWYYLSFRYERGKAAPDDALHDEAILVEIRRAIDRYVHKGFVEIDGVYIPARRGAIEDFVVEKYCKDDVSLDEFFALYDRFLTENDLTDESIQITDSMRATRANHLSESNRLLWKQNQRLRFYDVEGGDYTELYETLNLGQYRDVELSCRKFLVDYPELMAKYDLRDEYEVHNLLKKIHAESENQDLVFSRMPILQFGTFDRDAAVREILFAVAPVSQDDLAQMISLEYGIRPETIKANWLMCISEYYHKGIYSVDYEDMPEEHIALLKETLTDDFYYLTELRKIYSGLIPNADLTLLSAYNLKKMGFLVGTSYVVQNYSTAEAYFNHLLTDADVVDIAPISKRYTGLTTYSACLAGLRHDMEIIEFEPFQYINVRRLQKLGFTKERLRKYSDRVWSYLEDDEFFTIQSLHMSKQWHVARDYQVVSVISDLQPLLRKCATLEMQQKVKNAVFANIMMGTIGDSRKYIRNLSSMMDSGFFTAYIKDQERIGEALREDINEAAPENKKDLDLFVSTHEEAAENLQMSLDRSLLKAKKHETRNRPSRIVSKSITLLKDVDTNIFEKLTESERESLRGQLGRLATVVERFDTMIDDGESSETATAEEKPVTVVTKKVVNTTPEKPRFYIAKRHIEEPFVHCLSAGKVLNALCVTLEFEVDMPRSGQKNELAYRAFFVDGANDIVSDIKELRLVSGEVVKSTFTLTAKASSSSQCMLALQSEIDNADELQQMIPFQVNISFTSDFDF